MSAAMTPASRVSAIDACTRPALDLTSLLLVRCVLAVAEGKAGLTKPVSEALLVLSAAAEDCLQHLLISAGYTTAG